MFPMLFAMFINTVEQSSFSNFFGCLLYTLQQYTCFWLVHDKQCERMT